MSEKRIAHYEVAELIGRGGMGEVYRARDSRLERDVAIKVLPAEFAKDPERLARFRREARLLASLHHTHIAAMHGLEETDDGTFLVMELVEGEDQDLEHSPTITAALTGHGVILGTAAYMSPEQARGRRIDPRTDIWAFGVILFEMLSGVRVFTGETISDTMAAVLRADPPWDELPEDTPVGVRRLLERCLERDSRRRLRDIGEARVRLERWREDPATLGESYISGVSAPVSAPRRTAMLPWTVAILFAVIAAFLGARTFTQDPPTPQLRHFEIDVEDEDRLVSNGTLIGLSPDGLWMAWNSTSGIYLRRVSEPAAQLLENTEGTFDFGFSPNSRWVGFAARGGLWRVNVQGGAPIRICDNPTARGFVWVDESTMVFTPAITTGLHMVDLGSGVTRQLTEPDAEAGERSHRWPTVVPGTRSVLFECQFLGRDYDESDVRLLSLDDGEVTTIYRGGAAPSATAHGQLLFVRDHTLFAVPWSGSGPVTGGLPTPVLQNLLSSVGNQENDDGSAAYAVDQLGNLLYVDQGAAGGSMTRLAWFDFETGEIAPWGPAALNEDAVLSRDGKLLAIGRTREGNENIYIHEIATGNETMLTHRESVEYLGTFSPDSRVLYWSQASELGNKFEVWRRPVDGSEPAEFVANSPLGAGFWPHGMSPDGRWLSTAAWTGATARDVYLIDTENLDQPPQLFAGGEGNQSQMNWLNDDFVFYLENAIPNGEILLRRFPDTGAVWTFPSHVEGYEYATPSFDGTALLAYAPDGIYRLPVETGGGNVSMGRPSLLQSRTPLDLVRISGEIPYPDGVRSLVRFRDSSAGELSVQSLMYMTGWTQDVAQRIKEGR